jgi:Ala-tRNA(Pro) deacylase
MSTTDIVRELAGEHVDYELVSHAHTERADDEAAALGVPVREVGKTLILKGSTGYVRAVIPASERLDLHKVRDRLDDPKLRLATEQELAEDYAVFELGAVPPLGGPAGDPILADYRIADLDRVIVEAGTHEQSIRIRAVDLLAVTGAALADICAEAPGSR